MRDQSESDVHRPADPAVVLVLIQTPTGSNPVLLLDGTWYPLTPSSARTACRPTCAAGAVGAAGPDALPTTRARPQLAVGVPLESDQRRLLRDRVARTSWRQTLESISISLLAAALLTTLAGAAVGLVGRPPGAAATASGIGDAAHAIATGRLDTRVEASADADLAPLADSFNEMAVALEERIQRDARFASNVSHELRSPLMTLAASIEVLENQRDDMPERAQAALDLMVADIDRFQQLVEDLLEISRFDAGVMHLDLEEVRVDELVHAGGRRPRPTPTCRSTSTPTWPAWW